MHNHFSDLVSVQHTYHHVLTKTGNFNRAKQFKQDYETSINEVLVDAGYGYLSSDQQLMEHVLHSIEILVASLSPGCLDKTGKTPDAGDNTRKRIRQAELERPGRTRRQAESRGAVGTAPVPGPKAKSKVPTKATPSERRNRRLREAGAGRVRLVALWFIAADSAEEDYLELWQVCVGEHFSFGVHIPIMAANRRL